MPCSTKGGGRARALRRVARDIRGQATVEAAFVIPVALFALGLLLQPGMLFFDKCVMASAASEACRLAATSSNSAQVEAFVQRRLRAIPNANPFKDPSCDFQIDVASDWSGGVQVRIRCYSRPLPLLGVAAGIVATKVQGGLACIEVSASSQVLPSWLEGSSGSPWG